MLWYDQRVQESSAEVAKITDLNQLDEMAASIREQQSIFYSRRAINRAITPEPTPYGSEERLIPRKAVVPYGPEIDLRDVTPENRVVDYGSLPSFDHPPPIIDIAETPVVDYGPPPDYRQQPADYYRAAKPSRDRNHQQSASEGGA